MNQQLKQAPQAWYSRIESHFIKEGFEKCVSEYTLFLKVKYKGKILIVSLYVDDFLYTGNDEALIHDFKKFMMKEFDMSDFGKLSYFLGEEVVQNEKGIFINQGEYSRNAFERFSMHNSKPVNNPIVSGSKPTKEGSGAKVDATKYKKMAGGLMYLTATRPDLMYVVSLVSRFMESPTEEHLQAIKRILRYVKGNETLGILYNSNCSGELVCYTDGDYDGDVSDRKSTCGYVFSLGFGAVSWASKKQPIVTLSTTEAEFVAVALCASQAI